MMNEYLWYAIVAIQIVAESLPISSSGHVTLVIMWWYVMHGISMYTSYAMDSISQQLHIDALDHVLHIPTIVITILFFTDRWYAWWYMLRRRWRTMRHVIVCVVCADVMTVMWYLVVRVYAVCTIPLWIGFTITGLLLYSLKWHTPKNNRLSIMGACALGCAQGLALLPGISRFAITYTTGRWLSLSPRHAFEWSWLIQFPLLVVSALHVVYVFTHHGIPYQMLNVGTWFTMLIAMVGAWYALRMVRVMIYMQRMWWFSWYMMIPIVCAYALVR